jgi:hypothetical protein
MALSLSLSAARACSKVCPLALQKCGARQLPCFRNTGHPLTPTQSRLYLATRLSWRCEAILLTEAKHAGVRG